MRRHGLIAASLITALLAVAVGLTRLAPAWMPPVVADAAASLGLGGSMGREPITLAVVTDRPEPNGNGATIVNGMRLLVDDVNRAGGINGRPLRIEVFDDAGTSEESKVVATTVARDTKAVAVIGHRLSTATKAAGPVYAEYGIAAISPASTSTDVTVDNPWLFRTVFNNDFLGRFITQYIHAVFAPREVIVAAGKQSYSRQLIELMRSEAKLLNMGVAEPQWVEAEPSEANSAAIAAIIDTLRATQGPRVLFMALYPEEAVPVVQAVREAGLDDVTLIGPDSLDRVDFPKLFKDLPSERRNPGYHTNGIIVASSLVYDTAGRNAGFFREQYVRHFGQAPDWRAALAYDAGKAVVEAIRRSGGAANADTAALRHSIRDGLAAINSLETAVEGVAGPVFFDGNGNANRPAGIARYQNGGIISDFDQFQTLRSVPNGARLPNLMAAGQVINVGDQLFERTRVAFAGLLPHDIGKVDLNAFTAAITGEIWFRFAHFEKETTAEEPSDIVFLNAVGPVVQEKQAESTSDDGIVYRRIRFSGTFRLDFVPGMRSYHHPTVGIEFRHRTLPSNRLLYVADLAGMGMSGGSGYTQSLSRLAPALEAQNWQIREATVFQGTAAVSTLGNPHYLNQDKGLVPYSTFVAVVRLDETATLSLASILPEQSGGVLLAAVAALVLLRLVNRSLRKPRTRLLLMAGELTSLAIILTVANALTTQALEAYLPFVYLNSIDHVFSAGWWLIVAYYLKMVIKRFFWEPLERRTGRTVPAILKHFVSAVIVLLCVFGIIAFVFNLPLTNLLATSGLLTLIIGLALQTNISNIFAGIVLSLERPFSIGDTIKFGDMEPAKVTDMSWRTTQLVDTFGHVRCIPNNKVAESVLINYSKRKPARDYFYLYLRPEIDPAHASQVMKRALGQCRHILQDQKYGAYYQGVYIVGQLAAARYSLGYFLDDYFTRWDAREEVVQRVWEALTAEGITPQVDPIHEYVNAGEPGKLIPAG